MSGTVAGSMLIKHEAKTYLTLHGIILSIQPLPAALYSLLELFLWYHISDFTSESRKNRCLEGRGAGEAAEG